jgi:hypothetical protein
MTGIASTGAARSRARFYFGFAGPAASSFR